MEPDRTEKGIRFGCGFVAGTVMVGGTIGDIWTPLEWKELLAFTAVGAVVFGYAAMQIGDRFWENLGDWLDW